MNRTEIKSFLPILQAFADGKEIECREEDKWYKVLEICNGTNPQDYRIKPEPKYRPFKDAEECWQEMQKHQPFLSIVCRYISDCDKEPAKKISTAVFSEKGHEYLVVDTKHGVCVIHAESCPCNKNK